MIRIYTSDEVRTIIWGVVLLTLGLTGAVMAFTTKAGQGTLLGLLEVIIFGLIALAGIILLPIQNKK